MRRPTEDELRVLHAIDASVRDIGKSPWGTEIAAALGMPENRVSRITLRLEGMGLIYRKDRKRGSARLTVGGYSALRGYRSADVAPGAPRMHTVSGGAFYPLAPRPCDVRLHDIATALSNLCRYNGHVTTFYSVAQHSRLVMERAGQLVRMTAFDASQAAVVRTLALLHDAAEAYLGDIIAPIKSHIGVVADRGDGVAWERFANTERRVRHEIFRGLGVGHLAELPDLGCPAWDLVEQADRELFATEMVVLRGVDPDDESLHGFPSPLAMRIEPQTPDVARAEFIGAAAACCLTPTLEPELEEAKA